MSVGIGDGCFGARSWSSFGGIMSVFGFARKLSEDSGGIVLGRERLLTIVAFWE